LLLHLYVFFRLILFQVLLLLQLFFELLLTFIFKIMQALLLSLLHPNVFFQLILWQFVDLHLLYDLFPILLVFFSQLNKQVLQFLVPQSFIHTYLLFYFKLFLIFIYFNHFINFRIHQNLNYFLFFLLTVLPRLHIVYFNHSVYFLPNPFFCLSPSLQEEFWLLHSSKHALLS
jgi:hypothetical protein